MPFTQAELDNIANTTLDFYIKGQALVQTMQDRPLLKALQGTKKTFPGGKADIRRNVKGDYTSAFAGYTHNDTVNYANPANNKQVAFPWKELHAGISVTHTELKIDGISVADTNGEDTVEHTDREVVAITNLLQDKLEDLTEGSTRSFNKMCWQDGTEDAKAFAGILSFLTDTPAVGVTGGLDRATTAWWQHRALVGVNKITADKTNQTLSKTLRSEVRQLRRYGGKPTLLLCGSGFLDALEVEVSEKGVYTQEGFANNGKNDIGISDISMRGAGTFVYDPTLDDLGFPKRCYFIDPKHLYLMVMDGEDMKPHTPARPADQYVLYRGLTWTGGMVADQLNCHGVYEVA